MSAHLHLHPATLQAPAARLRRSRAALLRSLSLAGLLVLWWLASSAGWIDPLFLPGPQAVLDRAWRTLHDGYLGATLGEHLAASLGRIGLALLAALLSAIPLGIACARSPLLGGLLDPLVELYRPVPPLAYLPLIVIWCGIGELSKVLLIYLAIFAPLLIASRSAIAGVDPLKLRAARSLGARPAQLVRHVLLPAALPQLLTGIRIALGIGWSTLVAAELIAAQRGIGFMVQGAAQFLVTDVVLLGILIIALVAFALELALRSLQRRLAPWHVLPD